MDLYVLMNKNNPLCDISLKDGEVVNVQRTRVDYIDLFPPALAKCVEKGLTCVEVNGWITNRHLPKTRYGIQKFLWDNEDLTLPSLVEQTLGVNLSDHYWLNPSGSLEWTDVAFFVNSFLPDFGDYLMQRRITCGSQMSPDVCTVGSTMKWWGTESGCHILYKGADKPGESQTYMPVREVFASKVLEILLQQLYNGSIFIPNSDFHKNKFGLYSKLPCFVDVDTEYVSFNALLRRYGRFGDESMFNHIQRLYGKYASILHTQILLDFLLLNEDRHTTNFGLIRCVDTGEYLRPAPIFANGRTLYYNTDVINHRYVESKPFNTSHKEQLKLISVKKHRDVLEILSECIGDLFDEVFEQSEESLDRKCLIRKDLLDRLHLLLKIKS